jgi:hypothetical protein
MCCGTALPIQSLFIAFRAYAHVTTCAGIHYCANFLVLDGKFCGAGFVVIEAHLDTRTNMFSMGVSINTGAFGFLL